ncbi:unnamed protein product [Durusdinium trenchii]
MASRSLWDSELVAGVAFRPQRCQASKRGPWIDSTYMADVKLAYRLYKDTRQDSSGKALLIYFHANAELCTDLETDVHQFFDCGFGAVLCPEFRGYAWSEGTPSLRSLYPDSEALINALPEILETNDLQLDMPIIVLGRSLGSACAIHLATAPNVCGLIIESGVMELLKLPMVMQFAMMMPQLLQALRQEPSPLKPLEELRQVRIPTVVIHGELDEMSPIDQAFAAHGACASPEKKLVKYRAGHNDLRLRARKEYFRELRLLCDRVVSGVPQVVPEQPQGWLEMLGEVFSASSLRCLPGMRRCFASSEDMNAETPR